MPAPPLLELEVAGALGIDLRIEIVGLRPVCVRRVQVLEVRHQPGAVELAVAEIAHQRCEPRAAEKTARVAHGVLAMNACPIGERRARDDDRAEQFRAHGGQHHHGPPRLAVSDHCRLTFSLRVAGDHMLQECRFCARNVLDCLACHGIGEEADEIAGMTGLDRDADLAVGLEPANTRAVAGPRIDDDERPLPLIEVEVARWHNTRQDIVHWACELAPVHDELNLEFQDVRGGLCRMCRVALTTLRHHIEEESRALKGIRPIVRYRVEERPRACVLSKIGCCALVHGVTPLRLHSPKQCSETSITVQRAGCEGSDRLALSELTLTTALRRCHPGFSRSSLGGVLT